MVATSTSSTLSSKIGIRPGQAILVDGLAAEPAASLAGSKDPLTAARWKVHECKGPKFPSMTALGALHVLVFTVFHHFMIFGLQRIDSMP